MGLKWFEYQGNTNENICTKRSNCQRIYFSSLERNRQGMYVKHSLDTWMWKGIILHSPLPTVLQTVAIKLWFLGSSVPKDKGYPGDKAPVIFLILLELCNRKVSFLFLREDGSSGPVPSHSPSSGGLPDLQVFILHCLLYVILLRSSGSSSSAARLDL